MSEFVDFTRINQACVGQDLVRRWLPQGYLRRNEWVCKNPSRDDRNAGSFYVHMDTGAYYDFATGERGSDFVALYAKVHGFESQAQAARALAAELGVDPDASGEVILPPPRPETFSEWRNRTYKETYQELAAVKRMISYLAPIWQKCKTSQLQESAADNLARLYDKVISLDNRLDTLLEPGADKDLFRDETGREP